MARSRREKRIADALGTYVRDKYAIAKQARLEHYDDMQECLSLLRGVGARASDDPDSMDLNIVAPITQGVLAMMQDVLGSTTDKPYTLKNTPIPDLPQEVLTQLIDAVQRNLPALLAAAGGDMDRVAGAVSSLRQTLLQAENSKADESAKNMERLIDDRMKDAGWTDNFLDFINNFVTYPIAVMKAPVSVIKKMKEWRGDRLRFTSKEVKTVENISPFDFLPAPNARDSQSAEYLIERRRLTSTQLLDLATLEGYNADAIQRVIKKYPDGYAEPYDDGNDAPPDSDNEDNGMEPPDCNGQYDAIGFYGRLPGRYLTTFGVELDDENEWHEAEVWCIGEEVIFAQLNPDPQGLRPFYTASMYPTPGSMYGSCVSMRLADTQRACTAAVRALVRNMAYASGPVGEVNPDSVVDDEDPRVVLPNQLRLVKPGFNGSQTYRFHDINSHAQELFGVFDKFLATAYELIGIPRIAFGSPTSIGSLGRTSGGLSILMNQAAKPIKQAMREIERKIVEPVIQRFVDEELMYNDDPTIKGDIRVYAQGMSGIEAEEQHTERLTWALQSIASLPPGTVPPTAILRLLYYIFDAYGIPTKGILPDFGLEDALSSDVDEVGGPQNGVPGQATATAQLDGRSPNAQNAIAVSNGDTGPTAPRMTGV